MKALGQVAPIRFRAPLEATGAYASQLMADLGVRLVGAGTEPGHVVEAKAAALSQGLLVDQIKTPAPILEASTPMAAAILAMAAAGARGAWVLHQGQPLGVVSLEDVLAELAVNRDPLTGLPGSDRLREWGRDQLSEGREITLLFIDLNDFGRYNKQHGHVVGDRVIKALAKTVQDMVDKSTDVFVRYGGDEFVWATTRPRSEAEAAASALRSTVIRVEEVPEPVGFVVGLSGGKRTKERTVLHIESTLENLINLASRSALSQKPPKQPDQPAINPAEAVRAALAELRRLRPEKADQLADIRYSVSPGAGLIVQMIDREGREMASAPLGQNLSASLGSALRAIS